MTLFLQPQEQLMKYTCTLKLRVLFIKCVVKVCSHSFHAERAELESWFALVQFSYSVMSNSVRPHGLQHARPPCPSPTPGVYSDSCPLSRWCHPTISSSVVPFFSRLQSFPALGSFHMNQFFTSGGQSIGVSASASVLPVNIQDWFPWILDLWDNLWRKFLCSGKFEKYCVEVKMPKF